MPALMNDQKGSVSRGKGDKGLRHALSQARLHHDRHDAGIEGELDDDAGTALDGFLQAGEQPPRRAVQHYGQEQEQEVDDVEVESAISQHEVIEQEQQARNADQPGQGAAVFQVLGRASDTHPGLLIFFQQGGVDIDAFVFAWQHQPVDQRHTDQQYGDDRQVEPGEDGFRSGNHADLLDGEVAFRCDGQWDRTGEPRMPDQKARIGTGDQQPVVDAHLASQLLGEKAPLPPGQSPS